MIGISEKLREIRTKHGLTTKQMAYFMKMKVNTYEFFEWGDPMWDQTKLYQRAEEIDRLLSFKEYEVIDYEVNS